MCRKKILGAIIRLFERMNARQRAEALELVRQKSIEKGATYQKEGKPVEITKVIPIPMLMEEHECRYVLRTCRLLHGVFLRVSRWRQQDEQIRRLLPLLPEEEEWMRECASQRTPEISVARWDADIDFTGRGVRGMKFFETNGVAIGGMNYGPASEAVASALIGRLWEEKRGTCLPFVPLGDVHSMFFRLLRNIARRSGGKGISVGWLQDETWTSGITEEPYLLEYFRKRRAAAMVADPRKLRVRGERIFLENTEINVLYRNMELVDLVDMEKAFGRLDAVRLAFRQAMVVSSLGAEFDHKSLFEVLTLPQVQRRLSSDEKRAIRLHIPWTCLLAERRTSGPDGRQVDLPAFVASNRAQLVMKPNRSCGGDGVTLGPYTSQARWEALLHRILRSGEEWVAQQFIKAATVPDPLITKRRPVGIGRIFANCGIFLLPGGMGILGRACGRPIVNVAQGGGLIAVMALKRS